LEREREVVPVATCYCYLLAAAEVWAERRWGRERKNVRKFIMDPQQETMS